MTEAEYNRERARVLRVAKKWKKRILRNWDVTYAFTPTLEADKQSGWSTAMECSAIWPYRRATVNVALESTKDMDDSRLEKSVVHEFIHAVVNQMREYVPDGCVNCGSNRTVSDGALKHEEAVVQNITDIILGVA